MRLKLKSSATGVPNMVPTIDILFQLIIFFVLAYRFAAVEQFPIAVPDNCTNAAASEEKRGVTVVTLMKNGDGIAVAVGSEKISHPAGKMIAADITDVLNARLKTANEKNRVVCLRIEKDIPFEQSQYALAGVASSIATDIQMSVLKEKAIAAAQ